MALILHHNSTRYIHTDTKDKNKTYPGSSKEAAPLHDSEAVG